MRYRESREDSAALLRMTVAHLGRHDAAPHPISFAVWYEHASGVNPRLSAAIEQALAVEPRMSEATVRRLYEEFVAGVDGATADGIRVQLLRMMQAMSESAADTGLKAGTFGDRLDGLATALRDRNLAPHLLPTLGQAMSHTVEMRSSVEHLQQRLTASQQEMTQLREALQRSREDALVDPLTRIANRRAFDQALASLLLRAPSPGRHHVLAMIDIDHFKRINDQHGHLVGDSVLQALGELLKRVCSSAEGLQCARYGGEEFVLLMADAAVTDAARRVDAIRASVRAMTVRQRSTGELLSEVTVSVGVTAWQAGASGPELLAAADRALYRAKAAGRDRMVLASARPNGDGVEGDRPLA